METLIASILVVVLIALVIFIFMNSKMEKFRKYTLILIPFIAFLLMYIFKKKTPNQSTVNQDTEKTEFKHKVEELKNDLKEVNDIVDLKKKYSDEKKEEDLKKIEEVSQITDKSERRRRIAEMVG